MGYYLLKPAAGNQFAWTLHADNKETILQSETYSSKGAAIGGITSCRENSPLESQYERFQDRAGQFRFRLKAKNHEIIGQSEGYVTSQGRENGITSCKANGPGSRVIDETGT